MSVNERMKFCVALTKKGEEISMRHNENTIKFIYN